MNHHLICTSHAPRSKPFATVNGWGYPHCCSEWGHRHLRSSGQSRESHLHHLVDAFCLTRHARDGHIRSINLLCRHGNLLWEAPGSWDPRYLYCSPRGWVLWVSNWLGPEKCIWTNQRIGPLRTSDKRDSLFLAAFHAAKCCFGSSVASLGKKTESSPGIWWMVTVMWGQAGVVSVMRFVPRLVVHMVFLNRVCLFCKLCYVYLCTLVGLQAERNFCCDANLACHAWFFRDTSPLPDSNPF